MSDSIIRTRVEQAYDEFIQKSFLIAAENALIGEPNAVERFKYAVEVVTKLKNEILKEYGRVR